MSDNARVVPFRPPKSDKPDFVRQVFEHHHEALLRFIQRMGLDQDESRDIAQGVYLRLVRQNDSEKLERAPRSYLYTIATNLVRDQIRKNRRQNEEQADSDQVDVANQELMTDEAADVYRKLDRLKQALLELPANKQRVLLLNRFHGMSCRQISEELGIPFRTVQRYLDDALLFCKSKMRYYRD